MVEPRYDRAGLRQEQAFPVTPRSSFEAPVGNVLYSREIPVGKFQEVALEVRALTLGVASYIDLSIEVSNDRSNWSQLRDIERDEPNNVWIDAGESAIRLSSDISVNQDFPPIDVTTYSFARIKVNAQDLNGLEFSIGLRGGL